jgi:hypothetical protein
MMQASMFDRESIHPDLAGQTPTGSGAYSVAFDPYVRARTLRVSLATTGHSIAQKIRPFRDERLKEDSRS